MVAGGPAGRRDAGGRGAEGPVAAAGRGLAGGERGRGARGLAAPPRRRLAGGGGGGGLRPLPGVGSAGAEGF